MPPKKDAKAQPANVEVGPEQQAAAYRLQAETLQRQLAERTDKLLASERAAEELRARLRQTGQDATAGEQDQRDVTAEMARQYRAMQEQLQGRIGALEGELRGVRAELADARRQSEEARAAQGALGAAKDQEIARLKEQMEAMASEFGDMLAETIRKMGDKIELDVEIGHESNELLMQMEQGAAAAVSGGGGAK